MKRITMFFVLLIMSTSARSAIIDSGTFFTDTESGLDWLKWESSGGRSYDYVVDNMDIGEEFYGWSYTGRSEYDRLLCNVFSFDSCISIFNSITEVLNHGVVIEDLFGVSGTRIWNTIDPSGNNCETTCQEGLAIGTYDFLQGPVIQTGLEHADPYGNLLIRPATVPIPASAWLFGSSLIGILLARRNK